MAATNKNNVKLTVDGNVYEGAWSEVHIRRSMMNISGIYGLSSVDFFSEEKDIKMGDEVTVHIDDQLVLTGYIEQLDVSYDAQSHYVHIKGRDKTGDLVDCSHEASVNEWKNQTLQTVIANLVSPFGISVLADSTVTSEVEKILLCFKANEGESVYKQISDLCYDNGILPISYGDGRLTLTKVTAENRAADPLQFGVNVTDGKLIQDNRNRYKDYTVKGMGIGTDNKVFADYIEPVGVASDSVIERHRPLVLFQDRATDSGKCATRARWEAGIRAGFSRAIRYEINEWNQKNNKKLWDMNMLVAVKDEFLGIDTTMIIAEVDYLMDEEEGVRASLLVVDKDTFSGNAAEVRIKTGLFDAE